MSSIRKITSNDLESLKHIIDSTELFPSDMLDDMTVAFLNQPDTPEIWLTQEYEGQPVVIAYCAPERMTEGTYNLYLIAVHKNHQGKGFGAQMMAFIESYLRTQNVRILIVETSGLAAFEATRQFYLKIGYTKEAVIRDFYQAGEDKVVFWKRL